MILKNCKNYSIFRKKTKFQNYSRIFTNPNVFATSEKSPNIKAPITPIVRSVLTVFTALQRDKTDRICTIAKGLPYIVPITQECATSWILRQDRQFTESHNS